MLISSVARCTSEVLEWHTDLIRSVIVRAVHLGAFDVKVGFAFECFVVHIVVLSLLPSVTAVTPVF